MFDRLDHMNAACIDRFSTWFAYHLSNFMFRWSWEDWSSCLTLDPLHPKPKFIKESLAKCMRLSYHQRIVETVPETFHSLIPESPAPYNKYEKESDAVSTEEFTVAQQVRTAIQEKEQPDQVVELLDVLPNPNEDSIEGKQTVT